MNSGIDKTDRSCRRPRPRRLVRSAYTLLELVVASATSAVLMGGLGASIYIASQSLDVGAGSLAESRIARQVLETINRDLESAIVVSELTPTSVSMSVPDRDGDGVPESIRYSWSGISGDPLLSTYNGGVETEIATNVRAFSLASRNRFIEGVSSRPRVLFVTEQAPDGEGGLGTPTSAEQDRINLIEGWGYRVTVISQQASQSEIDEELESANIVYVPGQCSSATVGTKFNATVAGIVTELFQHSQTLGLFDSGIGVDLSASTVSIKNNTHYITTEHSVGVLPLLTAEQTMKITNAPMAFHSDKLASSLVDTPYPSLLAIDAGDKLVDDSDAPGRRVQLPWGEDGFDATLLNTDGQILMRRAIEWAAGAGADTEVVGVNYQEFTEKKLTSDTNSVTIDLPPGTAADDLLIAAVACDGNTSATMSAPIGWNQVLVDSDGSSKVTLGVWWKLATSSESSNYTFTWTGNERAYGWVMRFTGHDTANPINVSAAGEGSSSSPTAPDVTTTVDNTLLLRIGGFDDDEVNTGDAGMADHTTITMKKTDMIIFDWNVSGGAAYAYQMVAGNSGSADFTIDHNENYVTVTIAIAPETTP